MEAEFGQPQWVFGESTYAFAAAERLIAHILATGRVPLLASLNTRTLALT
ncbi:MAG: hypothetical protein R2911_35025 [Caldilineaceae bacterium]